MNYEAMWKELKDELEYTATHHELEQDKLTGVVNFKKNAEMAARFVERMNRIEVLASMKAVVVPTTMEPT